MTETFRRAHEHRGTSFVEVYQNCNVFNDGAFEGITAKANRDAMLISLQHGEPIIFGAEQERGVRQLPDGRLELVLVADVGQEAILVHDAHREDPGLAFSLSRLSSGPHQPTPVGVFRDIHRPDYGTEVAKQIEHAQAERGTGDLAKLLRSAGSWTVG